MELSQHTSAFTFFVFEDSFHPSLRSAPQRWSALYFVLSIFSPARNCSRVARLVKMQLAALLSALWLTATAQAVDTLGKTNAII